MSPAGLSPGDPNPYALLENKLHYTFSDRAMLESALTHKSYINENPLWQRADNERLEFLGDAVIDLVVGHVLMDTYPSRSEGELSKTRASLVSELGLSEVAALLGLGEWLFLGRGEEQSGGRRKPSVLANACEAIVAAIYLDGGYEAAFTVVRQLFVARVLGTHVTGIGDFKTRLQERVARSKQTVRYTVIAETGPDHDKRFEVVVTLGDHESARGAGRTKKEAEQRAAELALQALDRDS